VNAYGRLGLLHEHDFRQLFIANTISQVGSQIAGPTVAGFAIQALTAPVAVAADALSFAGSALFVGLIRSSEDLPERKPDTNLRREVMEGLRFVFGNRLLRAIALSIASYNLLSAARGAMLIVLLAGVLQLPAGTIGVFFSIASVGGLLGALTATKIAARRNCAGGRPHRRSTRTTARTPAHALVGRRRRADPRPAAVLLPATDNAPAAHLG
jgi:hypothetical protein